MCRRPTSKPHETITKPLTKPPDFYHTFHETGEFYNYYLYVRETYFSLERWFRRFVDKIVVSWLVSWWFRGWRPSRTSRNRCQNFPNIICNCRVWSYSDLSGNASLNHPMLPEVPYLRRNPMKRWGVLRHGHLEYIVAREIDDHKGRKRRTNLNDNMYEHMVVCIWGQPPWPILNYRLHFYIYPARPPISMLISRLVFLQNK